MTCVRQLHGKCTILSCNKNHSNKTVPIIFTWFTHFMVRVFQYYISKWILKTTRLLINVINTYCNNPNSCSRCKAIVSDLLDSKHIRLAERLINMIWDVLHVTWLNIQECNSMFLKMTVLFTNFLFSCVQLKH